MKAESALCCTGIQHGHPAGFSRDLQIAIRTDENRLIDSGRSSDGKIARQLYCIKRRKTMVIEQFAGEVKNRISQDLPEKSAFQVSLESSQQFVREPLTNFPGSLTLAKCRSTLPASAISR